MKKDSAFCFSGSQKFFLDGEITRLILRRRKLRQGQVAKQLAVSGAQFFQYLAGKYPLNARAVWLLAKILRLENPELIIKRAESTHA